MRPLIRAPLELLLPADRDAALLVLGDAGAPLWAEGRRGATHGAAGSFAAAVRLPGGPDPSPRSLERLWTSIHSDGVVIWVARSGERPVPVPPPLDAIRFLARGRSLWRPEAGWVRPLASASKVDLARSLLGLAERPTHEIQLVARGRGLERVWLSELLGRIGPPIADEVVRDSLGRIDRTETGLVICQIRTRQGAVLALKVGQGERLRDRLARDTRVVGNLVRRGLPPPIARALPGALAAGEHREAAYRVEPWIEGQPAARLMYRVGARERGVDAALSWVGELHAATRCEPRAPESLADQARAVLRRAGEQVSADGVGFADAVGSYVERRLRRHVVPGVHGHGDFWLGNVVCSADAGLVTGVLDWDLGDAQAPPLEDPLHLLFYRKGPLRPYDPGARLADFLRGRCGATDRGRIADYLRRLQVDAGAVGALALVYWVRYLDTRESFLRGLRAGTARAYLPVRRVVEGALEAGLDSLGSRLLAG